MGAMTARKAPTEGFSLVENGSMAGRKQAEGFSYVEVMVAMLLVVTALLPALDSLFGAMGAARHRATVTEEHYHVFGKLEEMLAQPFWELDAEAVAVADSTVPTSYSEAPGTFRRRLVYLARYDGDNFDGDEQPLTGGDPGLLWIRVEIENGRSLETVTIP